jgi:hypothetical protein
VVGRFPVEHIFLLDDPLDSAETDNTHLEATAFNNLDHSPKMFVGDCNRWAEVKHVEH